MTLPPVPPVTPQESADRAPATLVFDVGLVLIDADYAPFVAFMRAHGAEVAGMDELCARVDLDAHERGEVDADAFLERLAALAPHRPDPGALKAHWNAFYTPVPDMIALVRASMADYRVHLLSNMGELHWHHLEEAFGIPSLGHGALASYTVGVLKPEPGIYAAAEQRFGLEPARTIFIDDRAVNVAAARARGWAAILHLDPATTRHELRGLGVKVPA